MPIPVSEVLSLSMPRPSERAVARIPLARIHPDPALPRRRIPEESVAQLAESIRLHGLLSPLLVREDGDGDYRLIAGMRRLKALVMLRRSTAEAVVLTAGDCDCALIALVENLQREPLHYLDVAEACRHILDRYPITQERLAVGLSCSPSALANRLRLLKLSPAVQAAVRCHNLSERHARALLRLPDEAVQLALAAQVSERHMSVRQLERRVDEALRQPAAPVQKISALVRDNRLFINAVLDTVRRLSRIGAPVKSRVEEAEGCVHVIVTIGAAGHGKTAI